MISKIICDSINLHLILVGSNLKVPSRPHAIGSFCPVICHNQNAFGEEEIEWLRTDFYHLSKMHPCKPDRTDENIDTVGGNVYPEYV